MSKTEPASPVPAASDGDHRWGVVGPANAEISCNHEMRRVDRVHHGSFIVVTTICARCGKALGEEKVSALERVRCPVDAQLDRCLLSCPVEEGSLLVFENPCVPVMNAMRDSGLASILPVSALPRESLRTH